MHYTTLLIDTVAPFSTLAFQVSSSTPLASLESEISARYPDLPYHALSLASPCGSDLSCNAPLSTLAANGDLVTLRLMPSLLGGKGGFGSQLRAAGGRMSSQKASNNDSCRDLNGRRLSTIKEAKKIAAYLEGESDRKKAATEEKRAKLEALEKQLGITPGESSKDGEPSTAPKRRFDDTEYLEQSREITDGVKSAVAAGLRKKRKKNKAASPVEPAPTKASEPAPAPAAEPAEAPASEPATETVAPVATPVVAASA